MTPQKPQQIRVSSPSTPNNSNNHHNINNLPKKNSWHSSYAPLGKIEVEIKKEGPQAVHHTGTSLVALRI
jgi:hypothetical protein